jgi:hypothetical protein
MLDEGKPRPHWKPLIPRLPVLGAVIAAVCWIWYCVGEHPPVSLAIVGSLLVALCGIMATDLQSRLIARTGPAFPGHRIRTLSRQDLRNQRADRHANLRVAAYTVPVSALLGAAAVWLLHAY